MCGGQIPPARFKQPRASPQPAHRMTPKILFLYISTSSGHQKAADAIQEALHQAHPSWETQGVDAFSFAYPTIGKIISKSYLEMLRHTPILWDLMYDNPDVEAATREIRDLLNLISLPKMWALLKEHHPQAIVCTQAVPCSVFSAEKRRGKSRIPLIAVVTDFALHAYWVQPEVDLYCVACEEERNYLIQHGVPGEKIAVTGIPVSPSFLRHTPKAKARSLLSLDSKTATLLLMGGSQGLGPLEQLLERLQRSSYQVLVTTGHNREAYRELLQRYRRQRHIRILGYTQQVGLLMDAADLLVTKPGGLTSSEALVKSLPMVIVDPIPGQEERNARFLTKAGTAIQINDPADIVSAVDGLLEHPTRYKKMVEKTRQIAHPYAAMEVTRHISRLLESI